MNLQGARARQHLASNAKARSCSLASTEDPPAILPERQLPMGPPGLQLDVHRLAHGALMWAQVGLLHVHPGPVCRLSMVPLGPLSLRCTRPTDTAEGGCDHAGGADMYDEVHTLSGRDVLPQSCPAALSAGR